MDRQQTVRRRSRQPIRQQGSVSNSKGCVSQVKQPPVPAKQMLLLSLQLLNRLLQRPSLVWLAAWAMLVGSATAAMMTILNPDASVRWSAVPVQSIADLRSEDLQTESNSPLASELQQAPPADSALPPVSSPELAQPRSASPPQSEPVSPVSAIGAILLSCAAGCFLLSQWVKPQPPIRSAKRSKPNQTATRPPQPQVVPATVSPTPAALPLPALPGSIQPFPISISNSQSQPVYYPQPSYQPQSAYQSQPSYQLQPMTGQPDATEGPTPEVAVSVVPTDQSHPLDWDEPSLADSLDLRQRRPLSYWL